MLNQKNQNEFYVYCYMDPRKPGKYTYDGLDICFLYEPFYIGFGKEKRIKSHLTKFELNNENRIKHNTKKNNIKGHGYFLGILIDILLFYLEMKPQTNNFNQNIQIDKEINIYNDDNLYKKWFKKLNINLINSYVFKKTF